ncbi:MAG: Ribonuclease P protein component [Eubacteriales bacterium SKADARSKE-1]|nr:Ribonuclease P protein component [Eubacteriales bacterium SKADARSKE-1]
MGDITTLNQNKDFNRAYSKGRSYVCHALVVYIIKNYKKGTRIGITTSKKIGNAVERNRARRVIKEAYRQIAPKISGNFDIVFVARRPATNTLSTKIMEQMLKQLKLAGLVS